MFVYESKEITPSKEFIDSLSKAVKSMIEERYNELIKIHKNHEKVIIILKNEFKYVCEISG
jgi:hypothetical protein